MSVSAKCPQELGSLCKLDGFEQAHRVYAPHGEKIYTLNLFDELASHPSGSDDTRLCQLIADGRLNAQIELELSWRAASRAIEALLNRSIGGKVVLHIDGH